MPLLAFCDHHMVAALLCISLGPRFMSFLRPDDMLAWCCARTAGQSTASWGRSALRGIANGGLSWTLIGHSPPLRLLLPGSFSLLMR